MEVIYLVLPIEATTMQLYHYQSWAEVPTYAVIILYSVLIDFWIAPSRSFQWTYIYQSYAV